MREIWHINHKTFSSIWSLIIHIKSYISTTTRKKKLLKRCVLFLEEDYIPEICPVSQTSPNRMSSVHKPERQEWSVVTRCYMSPAWGGPGSSKVRDSGECQGQSCCMVRSPWGERELLIGQRSPQIPRPDHGLLESHWRIPEAAPDKPLQVQVSGLQSQNVI